MNQLSIIDAARAELAAIEKRRAAILQLLLAYGVEAPKDLIEKEIFSSPPSSQGARRRSRTSKYAHIVDEARNYVLSNDNSPATLADIFNHLDKSGFKIDSEKPMSTLSAILSNSEQFANSGRNKWQCADSARPTGAKASPVESTGDADATRGDSSNWSKPLDIINP